MEEIQDAILANLGNVGLATNTAVLTDANFEMNASPADLAKAEAYRSSIMIRSKSNAPNNELSVCSTNIKELGEYGIGLELYFLTIKQVGLVFLLISVISIVPLYENYVGGGLQDGDKKQAWDVFTLANQDNFDYTMSQSEAEKELYSSSNPKIYLVIADLVYTLIFLFFIVYSQIRSKERIETNSKKIVTAADFALEVSGFPCECFMKSEVEVLFDKFGDTVEIYLARKYDGVLGSYKERAELMMELKYQERLIKDRIGSEKRISEIKKKIAIFDAKKEENEQKTALHDHLPVIKAYVIFTKIEDKAKCLRAFKKANSLCGSYPKDMKFRGTHKLKVKTTSEPSNIIWENLEYNKCKRFLRQVIAVIVACLVLVISIILVYLIRSFDDGLPDQKQCVVEYNVDTSVSIATAKSIYTSDDQEYCYCRSLSLTDILSDSTLNSYCSYYLKQRSLSVTIRFLASAGVVMINFFLKIVFRMLSRFEKATSVSIEQVKVMRKVFVAMFINTALVVLAVNADFSSLEFISYLPFSQYIFNTAFSDFTRQWYVQAGSTITITLIVSIFSPHLLNIILFYPRGACKRRCCIKRYKTQREINMAFTGPEFDIATRYSQILNVIFSSFLYSGGIPLLNVTCCLTMFCLYWVDKFLVLRHYSKPPRYSQALNDNFIALLPYAAIFHCGFSLYMIGCEEIFPLHFYQKNGVLYAYTNTLYDRLISIPGLINLGVIAVAIMIILYISSSNWLFKCSFKRKSAAVSPEAKSDVRTYYDEIAYITSHGLPTYDITFNFKYRELILALNALAQAKLPARQKSMNESRDALLGDN